VQRDIEPRTGRGRYYAVETEAATERRSGHEAANSGSDFEPNLHQTSGEGNTERLVSDRALLITLSKVGPTPALSVQRGKDCLASRLPTLREGIRN
jgi:hypothetical protein